MLEPFDYLLLTVFGSLGAFLSGLLGVGGGIIYLPVLDYFLYKAGMRDDFLVKSILANSLFTIIFSGSVSSYQQYKSGNFFPKEILSTALPGIITAVFFTYLIKQGNWYSKQLFNEVFAIMLCVISVRMFYKRKASVENSTKPQNWKYNVTGLLAGTVTAFSGLGGGVVMTPLFSDWIKENIKKASSISNGVIPLFAIAVGLLNLSTQAPYQVSSWQVGYILLPVVLPMIAVTFVFAPLGVKTAQKLSQTTIRTIFGTFVSIVFIKLIYEIFHF